VIADRRVLRPAEHVVPPPVDGWRAADLSPDELVDDEFIAADPTSYVVEPD
jgi:hypothetical protein